MANYYQRIRVLRMSQLLDMTLEVREIELLYIFFLIENHLYVHYGWQFNIFCRTPNNCYRIWSWINL